jgi:DNA-binding cell septation regulator SpoVG
MANTWALDDRAQLHKDANALLTQNLTSGERVMAIIRGTFDSALITTDRRAFVFKKGLFAAAMFGKKLESYDYRNLTGVQLEKESCRGSCLSRGLGSRARTSRIGRAARAI